MNDSTDRADVNTEDYISDLASKLKDINAIREELIKLELNPMARIYFDNNINPLLTTLYELSATSLSLATSANLLSTSIIARSKDSKIKETTNLVYRINEQCEDIYKELNIKIKELLKIVSC